MAPIPPTWSASRFSNRWLGLVSEWFAPEENPSAIVYGILTTGALLAAESTQNETLPEAIGASVITLILYWLAHAYSHALGDRLESGHRWSARQLLRIAGQEAGLLKGATLPIVALVLAAAAGASPADAVTAALVTTAVLLVVVEWFAGWRARLRGFELLVQIVVAGSLGLGLVLLKVVVH